MKQGISEVGERPTLCLSNRVINERAGLISASH